MTELVEALGEPSETELDEDEELDEAAPEEVDESGETDETAETKSDQAGETASDEAPSPEWVASEWQRVKGLIDSEIERGYSAWKRQRAAETADNWLDEVEAHTSPEALQRREYILALQVDQTIRLLRQMRSQDQDGNGPEAQADEKTGHPPPLHPNPTM